MILQLVLHKRFIHVRLTYSYLKSDKTLQLEMPSFDSPYAVLLTIFSLNLMLGIFLLLTSSTRMYFCDCIEIVTSFLRYPNAGSILLHSRQNATFYTLHTSVGPLMVRLVAQRCISGVMKEAVMQDLAWYTPSNRNPLTSFLQQRMPPCAAKDDQYAFPYKEIDVEVFCDRWYVTENGLSEEPTRIFDQLIAYNIVYGDCKTSCFRSI